MVTVRLATAAFVLLLSSWAVVQGCRIVAFGAGRDNPPGKGDNFRTRQPPPVASGTAAAKSGAGTPDAQTSPGAGMVDGRGRADRLFARLAARPLSSTDWLSLAGAWTMSGARQDQILSALTMSYLTGPNEGAVMLERALFGVLSWENLPEDMRDRTIHDLAGALLETEITRGGFAITRSVLVAKPPDVRSRIAEMLLAEHAPAQMLAQIGL
jgi:hypothetical protein